MDVQIVSVWFPTTFAHLCPVASASQRWRRPKISALILASGLVLVLSRCAWPSLRALGAWLRHWLQERRRSLHADGCQTEGWRPQVAQRQSSGIDDPTFGATFGIVYKRGRHSEAWEDFLDAMNFSRNTPLREHVRQLYGRPEFEEQLKGLFDALEDGSGRLTGGDVERLSRGLRGHVRVLLKQDTRVDLLPATPEDHQWILDGLEKIFPPNEPLDRDIFPSLMKLLLIRRIVRTLIESIGSEQLRDGVAAPLVVDVSVHLGQESPPFRVHTVAPASAPSRTSGERLARLAEDDSES